LSVFPHGSAAGIVFPDMRRQAPALLELEEATRRLRPFARRHVGVRPIPVAQIVGTDSRTADFDRRFRPRRRDAAARMRSVAAAFPDGAFPPIVVHRLGDAYFVLDGHHRVAAARRLGVELMDAEVTELHARWQLRADAGPEELVHAEQELRFMEESGLVSVLPGAAIRFTQAVGYRQLLESVQLHGYERMRRERRLLEPGEVALDWYEHVYVPVVEVIRQEGLERACRGATEPDVFLTAHRRRRELLLDCPCADLAEAARRLLQAT
jgi:hypothetical protein